MRAFSFIRSETTFQLALAGILSGTCLGHFPALMSVGAVLLFINGFFYGGMKSLSDLLFIGFLLLYAWHLIGGFYSTHLDKFWIESQLKFSYILISGGLLINRKRISASLIVIPLYIYILTVFFIGVASLYNYWIHRELYHVKLLESQGLPVISGISHITYGILMTGAVGCCLWLLILKEKFEYKSLNSRVIKFVLSLILFFLLLAGHIIGSRTGLIALYFTATIVFIYYFYKKGQKIWVLSIPVLGVVLAFLAYLFIPVIQLKVHNTLEDVHRYFSGEYFGFYSISMRFEAWNICFKLWLENIWLGVGSADLDAEMIRIYTEKGISSYAWVYEAHNQFLEQLTCGGVPAFLLFIFILFRAFIYRFNIYSLWFFTLIFVSFQFESFLEIHNGVAWFTAFVNLIYILNTSHDR